MHMYVCVHTYVLCTHVRTYVSTYIHMYVSMYACTYAYINTVNTLVCVTVLHMYIY